MRPTFTAALLLTFPLPATAAPPDILIYIADDHSARDSTVYGGTDIPTPHLERLAADGMTFTRAFVASPACAPSRAALLTGLMPARNGAEENHSRPRDDIRKLPAYLQELGYEVAAFGKVGHGKGAGERYGFDVADGAKDLAPLRRNVTEYLERRGRDEERRDRPLCLFVGISHPHVLWPEETAFDPADMHLPPTWVDTPVTRRQRARYAQEVKELDGFLGELRTLAAAHLRPDALFAYTSDHGAQFPFGKWTLYDEGIRVPLVVAWPGHVAPGSTADAFVSWVDLLPTLVELAGGTPPRDLDGYSFADVLRGDADVHRAEVFATHSGDRDKNVYPSRAVRTADWKYIRNLHPEYAFTSHIDLLVRPDAGVYWLSWLERAKTDPRAAAVVRRYHARPAEELYRVTEDTREQANLADDPRYADVKADLSLRLSAWMKRQRDAGTVFRDPYLLDEPQTWRAGKFAE